MAVMQLPACLVTANTCAMEKFILPAHDFVLQGFYVHYMIQRSVSWNFTHTINILCFFFLTTGMWIGFIGLRIGTGGGLL
jgi:hypothetical protein